MEDVVMTDVRLLKPHPRNEEFFDDIAGDKWEDFKESIRTSGVIEPILVTQDSVIVSGHQRRRACIEIESFNAPCIMRRFESEQEVVKCLIETNLQQRGVINSSKFKQAAIIAELEEIYGIQHGGDRKSKIKTPNGVLIGSNDPKTQEQVAELLGMSLRQYTRVKDFINIIPEVEDIAEENATPLNLLILIAKTLDEYQQRALMVKLAPLKGYTQDRVNLAIREFLKEQEKHETPLDAALLAKDRQIKELESQKNAAEMEAQKAKVLLEEQPEETAALEMENQNLLSELAIARTRSAEKENEAKALAQRLVLLQQNPPLPNDYEKTKKQVEEVTRQLEEAKAKAFEYQKKLGEALECARDLPLQLHTVLSSVQRTLAPYVAQAGVLGLYKGEQAREIGTALSETIAQLQALSTNVVCE